MNKRAKSDDWRRLRRVVVAPELLAALLKTGTVIRVRIAEGLPEGAELLSVATDAGGRCSLLVRHPTFAPVPQGGMPPEHRVLVATVK